jgi:hypothetical protein
VSILRKLGYALGVYIGAVAVGYAADGGDRFSTELVEIDIGAGCLIPRNYIVRIAPGIDGEGAQHVTMRALWPGLETLPEENAHLWEGRMPERQVHMAFSSARGTAIEPSKAQWRSAPSARHPSRAPSDW